MIELKTMRLGDVPIGGVFIADDRDFFADDYVDKEPFVKVNDVGTTCGFAEINGGIATYSGDSDAEVAFTGVVL